MKKAKKIVRITFLSIAGLIVLSFGWRTVTFLLDDNPNKTFLLPQVESLRVKVVSLSSTQSEAMLHISLRNHLPFALKGKKVKYSIFLGGKELIGGEHKKSIRLGVGGNNHVNLPITIYKENFLEVTSKLDRQQKDSAVYHLNFSIETNFFGERIIEYDVSSLLPVYHFPEMETKFLEIDSVRWKKTVIKLLVAIENKNVFALRAKDFSYRFTIDEYEWVEGHVPRDIVLEAKSVTELEIPVDIPYGELSKTLLELLFKGDDLKYILELHFTLKSSKFFVDNTKVILINSGSVNKLIRDN